MNIIIKKYDVQWAAALKDSGEKARVVLNFQQKTLSDFQEVLSSTQRNYHISALCYFQKSLLSLTLDQLIFCYLAAFITSIWWITVWEEAKFNVSLNKQVLSSRAGNMNKNIIMQVTAGAKNTCTSYMLIRNCFGTFSSMRLMPLKATLCIFFF